MMHKKVVILLRVSCIFDALPVVQVMVLLNPRVFTEKNCSQEYMRSKKPHALTVLLYTHTAAEQQC